jgi:hypothetical protein
MLPNSSGTHLIKVEKPHEAPRSTSQTSGFEILLLQAAATQDLHVTVLQLPPQGTIKDRRFCFPNLLPSHSRNTSLDRLQTREPFLRIAAHKMDDLDFASYGMYIADGFLEDGATTPNL